MINNFTSIDQLVEFGIGLAVAQQMVKMMNVAIADVSAPKVQNPGFTAFQQAAPALQLYVANAEGVAGPFDESQITELVRGGKLTPDTLVWQPGMSAWTKAFNVPLINKYIMLG